MADTHRPSGPSIASGLRARQTIFHHYARPSEQMYVAYAGVVGLSSCCGPCTSARHFLFNYFSFSFLFLEFVRADTLCGVQHDAVRNVDSFCFSFVIRLLESATDSVMFVPLKPTPRR